MPASLTPWAPSDREPQEVEKSPNGRYIRYNILLGKGACKRVYKALDTEEGLEVAWNQVDMLGMDRDEEARQHLQEEIRVLQQLKHKNIMTFYAWWYDKNNLHINFITELFTSGSLRQYRKKLKIMSENVLKRWAHQILEGLLYLHGHTPPIVHRDLKCDNIFVNSGTGEVKIGDLGLATVQQTAMSVVGTPEFMAPEVYDESYDERCDIYSFGMCVLELATLEYPYAECHSVPQIFKKVTLGIPPASLSRVSPELREFISLCIAHNPADRPSARELLKHPYLEAVRLSGSESHHCASLPSGGASSGALTSLSNGGPSNGWNTPSGTLHCAASVRDLRDALHQQEALARHHHQQQLLLQLSQQQQQQEHQLYPLHHHHFEHHHEQYHQQRQQQQILHSTCPDVHAVAVAAEAAAAAGSEGGSNTRVSGGGGDDEGSEGLTSRDIPRHNTVALGVLARSGTTNTSGGQRSQLGRTSKSPFVKTAAAATAAAAEGEAEGEGAALAGPPQLSPSAMTMAAAANSAAAAVDSASAATATATSAVAAARSTQSMSSSVGSGDSDTDSDEEVIVPIELLKAGLLEEGFVDAAAAAAAAAAFAPGPSDTWSDRAEVPVVDPTLVPSGAPGQSVATAAPAAAVTRGLSSHGSEEQQQQQRQRGRQPLPLPPRAPRSAVGMHRPGIAEGGGEGGAAAAGNREGAAVAMSVATAAAAMAEEEEEEEEEGEEGLGVDAGNVEEEEERELEGGDGKAVLDTGRRLAAGDVTAPALGLDSWTQRWALQGSLEAAVGMGHSGGGVEAAPSLACSVGSSASSTARRLSHGAGGGGSGGGGGRHSHQSSADAITFNVPLQPSCGSGASTPALRVSYSGNGPAPSTPPPVQLQLLQLPSLPPTGGVVPSMSPPVSYLSSSASADAAAAVAAAAPSPPLAMRGSVPSLGSTPAPGLVRLPSFRNRVLLTMQGTPGGGSCGGGSTPYGPYFRSTSARLESASLGGSSLCHTREVPSFVSTAAPTGHSMVAAGPGPGYNSLGAAPTFRPASSGDIDAAAAVMGVAASADVAAISSMGGSATEDRRSDGEMEGMSCQPVTRPRLAGVPEGDGEAGENGRLLPPPPPPPPPTSVMESANPPDGSRSSTADNPTKVIPSVSCHDDGTAASAPGAAMTAAAGQLSELADAGVIAAMDLPSTASILGGGAAAAAAVPADRMGKPMPMALAPAATVQAPPLPAELPVGLPPHPPPPPPSPPTPHTSQLPGEVTVLKEMSRPIQGVIMRLKQWKRLMQDRAKGRRS